MATPNRPAPDAIIASEWGGWVHDSVVYRCTSATRPASPQIGQTVYETDTARLMVYSGSTAGWTRPWSTPWGLQGIATSSNTTGPVGSTAADIYDLAVPFTATAGRYYRTTVTVPVYQQTAADGFVVLSLTNGTNAQISFVQQLVRSGESQTLMLVHVGTRPAGAVTYKARILTTGGSGSIAWATDHAASLFVEDVGPAGNPS